MSATTFRSGTVCRTTAVVKSTRTPGRGSGVIPRADSAEFVRAASDFPVPATSVAASAGEICAAGMRMRSDQAVSMYVLRCGVWAGHTPRVA